MQVALSALSYSTPFTECVHCIYVYAYVYVLCVMCALHICALYVHCMRTAYPLHIGFFERGWLEGRRAQRHMYHTRWEEATLTDSGCLPSVLLLGSMPTNTTATPSPTQSVAPLLTGETGGVLVLLAASRYGLEPLPLLHTALCVIMRGARGAAGAALGPARHGRATTRAVPRATRGPAWSRALRAAGGAAAAPLRPTRRRPKRRAARSKRLGQRHGAGGSPVRRAGVRAGATPRAATAGAPWPLAAAAAGSRRHLQPEA